MEGFIFAADATSNWVVAVERYSVSCAQEIASYTPLWLSVLRIPRSIEAEWTIYDPVVHVS